MAHFRGSPDAYIGSPSLMGMSIELTTGPAVVQVRLGGIEGLLALKRRIESSGRSSDRSECSSLRFGIGTMPA